MKIGKMKMTDTLLKKCIWLISLTAILALLVASVLMSGWIIRTMKPDRVHGISVLTEGISAKISYILHQNTQYLERFCKDDELLELAGEVFDEGKESSEIVDKLKPESFGQKMPGAIHSSRRAFLVSDWKDIICNPELEPYVETVLASDWIKTFQSECMEVPSHSPGFLRYPVDYSPMLSCIDLSGQEVDFLSMGMYREYMGHEFIVFLVEPFSDFMDILKEFEVAGITDYSLLGRNGAVLYASCEETPVMTMEQEDMSALFNEEQYIVRVTESSGYLIFGTRISYMAEDLKIAAVISDEELLLPYRDFVSKNIRILIVFTMVLVCMVILILRRILNKLGLLTAQMKEVRGGNYRVARKIASQDEVGMLAETFYEMMDQIQTDIQVIQEKEEREKQIEYSLMVSQVDPHFIYNSLNTITFLAEMNLTKDIKKLNRSLISILRDRLKATRLHTFDTLENEILQVENYITIQKYLCSGELELITEISEECRTQDYPKNILQPLVENSVVHGILLHRDEARRLIPGKIWIRVSRIGTETVTVIQDNGTGMTPEKMEQYFVYLPLAGEEVETEMSEHMAVYNIRRRLMYLYGEKFRIKAESLGEGTTITLYFPSEKPI